MTGPDRDYDDILSRALHSALDTIEPAGDGLAKIQQRTAEPWLKRHVWLLRTQMSALGWLILVRCEPFVNWARSGLAATVATAVHSLLQPGFARNGGGPATSTSGHPARAGAAARAGTPRRPA
jgi:hypothetical protein